MVEGSKTVEYLNEGWVRFARIYCKDGYIDRWMGDCINNPNNPNIHPMQLNSTTTYWRCNGSKWVSDRNLTRNGFACVKEFMDVCSADEIWSVLIDTKLG